MLKRLVLSCLMFRVWKIKNQQFHFFTLPFLCLRLFLCLRNENKRHFFVKNEKFRNMSYFFTVTPIYFIRVFRKSPHHNTEVTSVAKRHGCPVLIWQTFNTTMSDRTWSTVVDGTIRLSRERCGWRVPQQWLFRQVSSSLHTSRCFIPKICTAHQEHARAHTLHRLCM